MKKKIFLKSFTITLFSVLIVFFSGIAATYVGNKKIVGERLVTEANIVSVLLGSKESLSSLDVFANRDEFRITIISTSGEVLYDSDTQQRLENHIGREEVSAAIAGEPKTVERYSDTFKCKMTYYAVRADLGGEDIVLRLAVKSAQVNDYIKSTIPVLLAALLLSALVAGLFAKRLSQSVANRVSDISKSLRSVNEGDYIPLKTNIRDGELFAVYDEINLLNGKTVRHIQKEENEREKLNAVMDNISQGIIALSDSGRIVFVNRSALELFGNDERVISKELVFLVEDATLLERILGSSSEKSSCFECPMGERTILVEIAIPQAAILRGEVDRIVILTDITMQKELAHQKEEFFANASHELKTPLTAMLGLTELAMAKTEEEESKRRLARIHKESLRLSVLISDMLKLSQLESMQGGESAAKVSMRSITDEVLAELSEAIEAKGIKVDVFGEAVLLADERRMYELMQNLLSNAVSYNREGGSIDVKFEDTNFATLIRVKDTGIGIAPENIPHLCERFYRVDKSHSKKTGGTGLGLAIVKHICALYGAEISVSSEIGKGSEFVVMFKKPI